MRSLLLSMVLVLTSAVSAAAAVVNIDFSGNTSFNPGLPGSGAFGGSIQFDTAGASFVSGGLFTGVYSDIDFQVNGAVIRSGPAPTANTLTQVQLTTGADAFLSSYVGSFESTGVAGIDVSSVRLEIRLNNGVEMFDSIGNLFSEFSDNQVIQLSDIGYISLSVGYTSGGAIGSTILRGNTFDRFAMSVSDPVSVVPLPASAPLLLLALGGLLWQRRRKG